MELFVLLRQVGPIRVGVNFRRVDGRWNNNLSGKYKKGSVVRDPFQLRLNSYRVLLTRGRDGAVIFVPPLAVLDETYQHLVSAGMLDLDAPTPPPRKIDLWQEVD